MSMERGAREIEPVFRDRWVISKTLTALRVNLTGLTSQVYDRLTFLLIPLQGASCLRSTSSFARFGMTRRHGKQEASKGPELTIDTSTQAKPLSQELKLEIPRSFGSSLKSLIVRFADRSPPRMNTPTIKL